MNLSTQELYYKHGTTVVAKIAKCIVSCTTLNQLKGARAMIMTFHKNSPCLPSVSVAVNHLADLAAYKGQLIVCENSLALFYLIKQNKALDSLHSFFQGIRRIEGR